MAPQRSFPREIRTPDRSAFEQQTAPSSLRLVQQVSKSAEKDAELLATQDPRQRPAAFPVTFSSTIGHYTPADPKGEVSNTAVLMASAWGFEEMSSRRFNRVIAEKLADIGIPSLRYDYPGTGDALDGVSFSEGLDVWENSLVEAAEQLKNLSQCARLVVIGQSLGASLAIRAAHRLSNLDGLVLLAPVLSGRLFLRELSIWARTIDNNLQLLDEQRDTNPGAIAGLHMPAEIADQVKKLNLTQVAELPAASSLILVPRERPQETEFTDSLHSLGCNVEFGIFSGYDQMVANVTHSKVPMETVDRIVNWIGHIKKSATRVLPAPLPGEARPLVGPHFQETPYRFGNQNRLYGIFCEPLTEKHGATVLLMSTAYERHASWGRMNLHLARELAKDGIASFRFDTANAADSPPRPEAPEDVLYADIQQDDVKEALDFLEGLKNKNFVVAGRCSGAYLAFQSAVHEPRIRSLVAVNPYAFFWRQGESVEDFMKFVPKELSAYGPLLFKANTIRRLFNGEINAKAAVINITRDTCVKLLKKTGPLFTILPWVNSERKQVRADFDTLQERKIPFSLIYSDNDLGLRHFRDHFGADGAQIARYANVQLTMVKNADHNLTPPEARAIYFDQVKQAALSL